MRIIEAPRCTGTSGSVMTIAMMNDAIVQFDANHFCPLMTHWSPSRTALQVKLNGSEPPCGSVMA